MNTRFCNFMHFRRRNKHFLPCIVYTTFRVVVNQTFKCISNTQAFRGFAHSTAFTCNQLHHDLWDKLTLHPVNYYLAILYHSPMPSGLEKSVSCFEHLFPYACLIISLHSIKHRGILARWKLTRIYISFLDPKQLVSQVTHFAKRGL